MNRTALSGAFAQFLNQMDALVQAAPAEPALLDQAEHGLRTLIANDAWLPAAYKAADPIKYQQHALYIDPQSRYSVVSFVWGPGQQTPVHNHTVWGLVGVLEGEEGCDEFACDAHGHWQPSHAHALARGDVDRVSPAIGDVHRVRNALSDRPSISIHVYGGDIGRIERSVFDADGSVRPFITGYTNATPWITP